MRLRELAAIGLLTIAATQGQTSASGAGQRTDGESDSRQKLTVWRVVAVGPPRPVSIASLSPEVRTQTAGSFGQTSGSFGGAAGSSGKTAGSFGQTAGSVGTTAGSTGRTAGSFGESLDTISTAAESANGSEVSAPIGAAAAATVTGTTAIRARHDPAWERFSSGAKSRFEATFEDVGASELRARLEAVAGTADAPDVLVTVGRPKGWLWQETSLTSRFALRTLGAVEPIPQTETPETQTESADVAEAAILIRAPHPRAARAFVLQLLDGRRDMGGEVRASSQLQTVVATAKSALTSVLSGGEVGSESDREMAHFSGQTAQSIALQRESDESFGALKIDVNTVALMANERFAVVAMRAVMEGPDSFGAAHAVVVLRTDAAGQWRVLQLTPNLSVEQQEVALRELRDFAVTVRREYVEQLTRVALAAPVDGDIRPLVPELWWDTPGGGTMEIVEWQRSVPEGWTNSNLYFVPGESGHLRTRTTGRFANTPGLYRWRVWSMGRGGTAAISLWRSVNIVREHAGR